MNCRVWSGFCFALVLFVGSLGAVPLLYSLEAVPSPSAVPLALEPVRSISSGSVSGPSLVPAPSGLVADSVGPKPMNLFGATEITGCQADALNNPYTSPGDYVITKDIYATHSGSADWACLYFENTASSSKFTVDCQGHTIDLDQIGFGPSSNTRVGFRNSVLFDDVGAPANLFIGIAGYARNIELKNCKFSGDWTQGFNVGSVTGGTASVHDITLSGVGARISTVVTEAYNINGDAGGKTITVSAGTLRNSNIKNAFLSVGGTVRDSVFDDCLGGSGGYFYSNEFSDCDGSFSARTLQGNTFSNLKGSVVYQTGTGADQLVFDGNTFNNVLRPFEKNGGNNGDPTPQIRNNVVNEFKLDQVIQGVSTNPSNRVVSVDSGIAFTFSTYQYNGNSGTSGTFSIKSKYPSDQTVSVNGNVVTATPRRPGVNTFEIEYTVGTNKYYKKFSYLAVFSDIQVEEWGSTHYVDVDATTSWQTKDSHSGSLISGCAVAGEKTDSTYLMFPVVEGDPYLMPGSVISSIVFDGWTKGTSYQVGVQRFETASSTTDKSGSTRTNSGYQFVKDSFTNLNWAVDFNDLNWLALKVRGSSVGVQQKSAWDFRCGHWTSASQNGLNGGEIDHSRAYDNSGISLKFSKSISPVVINANRNVNFVLLSATSNKAAKASVNEYKVEFKSSGSQKLELRFLSSGSYSARFNGSACTSSSSTCKVLKSYDRSIVLEIASTGNNDTLDVTK